MQAFVYVLLQVDGARSCTYVGWTFDVARRLSQHNTGKGARFTRGRQWVVVHVEEYDDARAAMRREHALKRDRTFRDQLRRQGACAPLNELGGRANTGP